MKSEKKNVQPELVPSDDEKLYELIYKAGGKEIPLKDLLWIPLYQNLGRYKIRNRNLEVLKETQEYLNRISTTDVFYEIREVKYDL